MWRWWIVGLALCVASPGWAQRLAREGTTTPVDLTFTDPLGADTMPTSLSYRLDDRTSRIELLDDTTVATPSSSPCPSGLPGCVTITLPDTAMKIVGACKLASGAASTKMCLVDADCGSGNTCRSINEEYRDLELTLSWTFPGGQGKDRILLRTLNLSFSPSP